jgi:hypothetical protein
MKMKTFTFKTTVIAFSLICLFENVMAQSPTISGPNSNLCPSKAYTYTLNNIGDGCQANWIVSGGEASGDTYNTEKITVKWDNTSSGSIRITYGGGSACTQTPPPTYYVSINSISKPEISNSSYIACGSGQMTINATPASNATH